MSATAVAEKPVAQAELPFRFQLMVGDHIDSKGEGYVPAVLDAKGRVVKPSVHGEERKFHWKDPERNIIDTDVDLVAKYGKKFRRLHKESSGLAPMPTAREVELEKLSLPQLIGMAEDEKIDLKGASKKPEIIAVIRAARNNK